MTEHIRLFNVQSSVFRRPAEFRIEFTRTKESYVYLLYYYYYKCANI